MLVIKELKSWELNFHDWNWSTVSVILFCIWLSSYVQVHMGSKPTLPMLACGRTLSSSTNWSDVDDGGRGNIVGILLGCILGKASQKSNLNTFCSIHHQENEDFCWSITKYKQWLEGSYDLKGTWKKNGGHYEPW